jgi:hypothetical protein
MFVRRKEETTPASQIALVGHIINGTADIEAGDPFISLIPFFIQQRTYRIHDCIPASFKVWPHRKKREGSTCCRSILDMDARLFSKRR